MSKSNEPQKAKRARRHAELTEAEWAIMKVVWENEPCAAGQDFSGSFLAVQHRIVYNSD